MYSLLDQLVGAPALGMNIGQVNQNPVLTPPGTIVTASDYWWGSGEFIYAYASATIRAFGACNITPTFQTNQWRIEAAEIPVTANTGRSIAVAMQPMTAGQLGWFCIAGLVPVNSNAAVAAGVAIGAAAVGQLGANTAGKQVLNAGSMGGSATTVVKPNCTAPISTTLLQVPSSDGWFPGVFLSGTGIAAGTTVVSVDGSGRFVTLSAATTAAVAGSVTATYNNGVVFFNVLHSHRALLQGAIT